ncbi:hypothetical protein McanMca71_005379 [Microsporum canis]
MDALSMLDDEAVALMLQLEEIESYDRRRKGKYRADNLPDSELACEAFQAEIKGSIDLLSDLRLAHSIAHAVDSDGQVIAGILQDEAQARQDRRLALTTDGNADVPDTQKECPRLIAGPPEEESEPDGDSDGCSAGPSTSYTSRQEEAFRAAYTDSRTILYLSRAIPAISAYVAARKSPAREILTEEKEIFHNTEIEFSITDRTYCSNREYRKFIYPDRDPYGTKYRLLPYKSERNLLNQAEEVVDREAVQPIPHRERQRRVGRMREELLENHECDHPGRFQRIDEGPGRRGFACEMCGDRHWKYILQCRPSNRRDRVPRDVRTLRRYRSHLVDGRLTTCKKPISHTKVAPDHLWSLCLEQARATASRHGLRVVHSQPIFNKSHDGLGVFSDESGAILQSIREKLQIGKKSKIPNEILVKELQARVTTIEGDMGPMTEHKNLSVLVTLVPV